VDTPTFIAEMTKALAWPLVVAFIALLARKPVGVLLAGLRLQKAKGAGWEFEFSKLEASVQERVAELPAPKTGAPVLPSQVVSGSGDGLADMLSAWVDLERRVIDAARERNLSARNFVTALGELSEARAITAATAHALRGLQAMRNLAVHAPDDKKLAERVPHFLSMSQAMRWSLEQDLEKSKKP
jgi:hypothetical protein